jgi:hypothetical protein
MKWWIPLIKRKLQRTLSDRPSSVTLNFVFCENSANLLEECWVSIHWNIGYRPGSPGSSWNDWAERIAVCYVKPIPSRRPDGNGTEDAKFENKAKTVRGSGIIFSAASLFCMLLSCRFSSDNAQNQSQGGSLACDQYIIERVKHWFYKIWTPIHVFGSLLTL